MKAEHHGYRFQIQIPSCERAIVNRKIEKCLYCGASLPENLLFSKSEIERLDAQQREMEERRNRDRATQSGSVSDIRTGFDSVIDNVVDGAIDIASDLGGLFD